MVWDLSRETDMLIASSGKGDDAHNEPISKVLWYPAPGKRRTYHVSTLLSMCPILVHDWLC